MVYFHFTLSMQTEQLHNNVSEYYGKDIQKTSDLKFSACVCDAVKNKKHKEILSKVAPEVLEKYYGCGTPIPECLEGQTVLDLGSGTGRDVFLISALAGKNGHVIGVDMTQEQIIVANRALEHHFREFPDAAPIDFKYGFIEDLKTAGIADNSIDIVISNCVINLSSDKRSVFAEISRVLKPGGEVHISDIFCDKPLTQAAKMDKVLVGECIGNALDLNSFVDIMTLVGFGQIFAVEARKVDVSQVPPEIIDPSTNFYSITFSAFKPESFEEGINWENDVATYNGGIEEHESKYSLDINHHFPANKPVPVNNLVAKVLSTPRFNRYFTISKSDTPIHADPPKHFIQVIQEATCTQKAGPCCCSGGCCK